MADTDFTTPVEPASPEMNMKPKKKKPSLEIVKGETSVPVESAMDKKAFAQGFADAVTKRGLTGPQVAQVLKYASIKLKLGPELKKDMTHGAGECAHSVFAEKPTNPADHKIDPKKMDKKAFAAGFSDMCVSKGINPIALAKQAGLVENPEKQAAEKQAFLLNLLRMLGGGHAGRGAAIGGLGAGLLGGGAALGNWVNTEFNKAMGKK